MAGREGMDRRLRRLEGVDPAVFPWHLPICEWPDDALEAVADMMETAQTSWDGLTDEQCLAVAKRWNVQGGSGSTDWDVR